MTLTRRAHLKFRLQSRNCNQLVQPQRRSVTQQATRTPSKANSNAPRQQLVKPPRRSTPQQANRTSRKQEAPTASTDTLLLEENDDESFAPGNITSRWSHKSGSSRSKAPCTKIATPHARRNVTAPPYEHAHPTSTAHHATTMPRAPLSPTLGDKHPFRQRPSRSPRSPRPHDQGRTLAGRARGPTTEPRGPLKRRLHCALRKRLERQAVYIVEGRSPRELKAMGLSTLRNPRDHKTEDYPKAQGRHAKITPRARSIHDAAANEHAHLILTGHSATLRLAHESGTP